MPFGPPPIQPDIRQQLKEYIINPNIPIHDFQKSQQHWEQSLNASELYFYDLSPISTSLKVTRDLDTGELKDFKEILCNGEPLPKCDHKTKSVQDIINILESLDDFLENEGKKSFFNYVKEYFNSVMLIEIFFRLAYCSTLVF